MKLQINALIFSFSSLLHWFCFFTLYRSNKTASSNRALSCTGKQQSAFIGHCCHYWWLTISGKVMCGPLLEHPSSWRYICRVCACIYCITIDSAMCVECKYTYIYAHVHMHTNNYKIYVHTQIHAYMYIQTHTHTQRYKHAHAPTQTDLITDGFNFTDQALASHCSTVSSLKVNSLMIQWLQYKSNIVTLLWSMHKILCVLLNNNNQCKIFNTIYKP